MIGYLSFIVLIPLAAVVWKSTGGGLDGFWNAVTSPAALASLHMLAVSNDGYFATVEADDSMDPYGFGHTRWKASIEVPTGPGLGFDPDPDFLHRYDYAKE